MAQVKNVLRDGEKFQNKLEWKQRQTHHQLHQAAVLERRRSKLLRVVDERRIGAAQSVVESAFEGRAAVARIVAVINHHETSNPTNFLQLTRKAASSGKPSTILACWEMSAW